MCGFTGVISFEKIIDEVLESANNFAVCRGPDNLSKLKGQDNINYNLIFNRLSIVDLSENGNQPMISNNSNSILMFNGEIYNSSYLRTKYLKDKYKFKSSNSDTETLLAGLELFGIDFVKLLEGQFSFFYWPKDYKKFYLVRDRLGQKPLYFYQNQKSIGFASNLKSLVTYFKDKEIDISALGQYLSYGVVFSPNNILKNYKKIEPATILQIDYSKNIFIYNTQNYWKISSYIDNKKYNQEEFVELFSESVKKRMFSDVPIANFLSGGIDSTSIIKNMFDQNIKINSFSIIVKNSQLDESRYINKVVTKYNLNHQEFIVDKDIPNNLIIDSINSLDEPYGDPSLVLTYYLSKQIAKSYKVAISGDGGDELLGGYKRLKVMLNSNNLLKNLISRASLIYPNYLGTGNYFKSKSGNNEIAYKSFLEDENFYNLIFSQSHEKLKGIVFEEIEDEFKKFVLSDYKYYLADQMLLKIDRASMANSLEIRSPFVDHKLIEYVLSHEATYHNLKFQKKPLQDYLTDDFDDNFLNRIKNGFVFDYQTWVYANIDMIEQKLFDSISSQYNFIKISEFKKLKLFKTRINSLRIWRIFVLSIYLESIRDL